MDDGTEEVDPAAIIDALTEALLGQPLTLTRLDVARRTGIPDEVNAARWRTLGYPEVTDDDVAFTRSDVESLKAAARLIQGSAFDEASQEAFARTVGRTFSRLAEWQIRAMLLPYLHPESGRLTGKQIRELSELVKLGSKVQDNVWRRHLAGAATRLALQYADDPDSAPGCAGFVDIVGYTTRSRSMTTRELAALVERFESVVSDLVAEHHGRVVKTIGDEVFFVVDDPTDAAWLGAELADQHLHDDTFPKVRVGIAYGDLFHRLGDVLGPVVNMAARLTTVAPPGRAIIDAAMANQVASTGGLRLRRLRRISVKGFDIVEPWSVKIVREDGRTGLRGALDTAIEDAREELAMRLPQRGP
ncbi:MAG: adenylate/guanylate cyclase domain-containing protein [Aeromicrobium sp.]